MTKNVKKDTRKRPDPIFMRKVVTSAEDALESLRCADGEIAMIIGEETETIDEAVSNILIDFNDNRPKLLENENIYASLTVNVNKLTYKINREFSFGWLISYNIVDGAAVIDKISLQIVIFANNNSLILDLIDQGWTRVQKSK